MCLPMCKPMQSTVLQAKTTARSPLYSSEIMTSIFLCLSLTRAWVPAGSAYSSSQAPVPQRVVLEAAPAPSARARERTACLRRRCARAELLVCHALAVSDSRRHLTLSDGPGLAPLSRATCRAGSPAPRLPRPHPPASQPTAEASSRTTYRGGVGHDPEPWRLRHGFADTLPLRRTLPRAARTAAGDRLLWLRAVPHRGQVFV